MHYGDLLDIFHDSNEEKTQKNELEPNMFNKVRLSDDLQRINRKNSFLKSLEKTPFVQNDNPSRKELNMSFKQSENYNEDKGDLIRDIKTSLS